jgi:hypothetical protein
MRFPTANDTDIKWAWLTAEMEGLWCPLYQEIVDNFQKMTQDWVSLARSAFYTAEKKQLYNQFPDGQDAKLFRQVFMVITFQGEDLCLCSRNLVGQLASR